MKRPETGLGAGGLVLGFLPGPAFQQATLCLLGCCFPQWGFTGEMLRLH